MDAVRPLSRGKQIFLHLLLIALSSMLGARLAYSADAFWMNRSSRDVAPGQILHSFFSPVIYLPFYFMLKQFSPDMAGTILGAIHGLNLWLVAVIAWIVTPAPRWMERLPTAAAAL